MSSKPIRIVINNSKVSPFDHDKEIDAYLSSVKEILLEQPTDGRFGAGRLVYFSTHGRNSKYLDGYGDIQKLVPNYMIRTLIIGNTKPQPKTNVVSAADKVVLQNTKLNSSAIRIVEVLENGRDFIMPSSLTPVQLEPEIVDAVLKLKPILDEKGYDTYSEPISVKGVMGNLMVKAVRAPSNECLSCHTNIKPGQPIGYAMATIWKK